MLFSSPVEGFPGGSDGKECTSNAGDQALFFFPNNVDNQPVS